MAKAFMFLPCFFLWLNATKTAFILKSGNNILRFNKGLTLLLFIFTTAGINGQQKNYGVKTLRQELYLYHEFGKRWDSGISFKTYVSCDYGLFSWFIQGNAGYNVLPWFKIEALYRQSYYKLSADSSKWTYEQRPILRIASKFKKGNFKFRQRNTMELRIFELFKTTWRFKSDLRIKYSTGITMFDISPYITEEVFIGKWGYNRNRLYLGISGNKGRFSPILYMLMQSNRISNDWISHWIMGAAPDIRI